ncbi:DUF680 domain-containing protein [Mesorhizobium sp. CA14]|uniref:DUF680 domain-containing protein n=1 Tax=Mesorhizobium sp. CA14 TaxID=2876642 RepID=UPI001CCB8233|nr:DUF680 domain-containing protein [Mesorhizobium sp. CA14]MBZ9851564.1 DUF680 domain-containing protein [Mesorhizobium sp. CA14]
MKKMILALATVLAFSGAAVAGASHPAKHAPAAACAQANANVVLDCTATGSVEKADAAKTQTTKSPRLGIDVNPWFVPGL